MTLEVKRNLYHSIVSFLATECSCAGYSSDTIESLEVARQCLESAFDVSVNDAPKEDLLTIFQRNVQSGKQMPTVLEPTDEDKAMAEALKTQGNSCMIVEKFKEAIACYTSAIEKDPTSAVYFCNRAAAYSRLNNHEESLKDCERAIAIDPTYSKAYGRMGLAYSNSKNYTKAIEFYKKALDLDPESTNFKQNLEIAETRQRETAAAAGNGGVGGGGAGGMLGGLDLNALLSNPMMQNMAQRFMSDPNLQNSISSMMQSVIGGEGAGGMATDTTAASHNPAVSTENSGTPPNVAPNQYMDDILRIGQQFAQQMQQSNPELVSTLRATMQNVNPNNFGQNPPSSDAPPES